MIAIIDPFFLLKKVVLLGLSISMQKLTAIPTLEDLKMAHQAIQKYVHNTPILHSDSINALLGVDIHFKCENFQKIGAFKMRGASCAIAGLSEAERAAGVATHSSGNHAQAVALAARLNQIEAHIVMPRDAPQIKRKAVAGYGALIYDSEPDIKSRHTRTQEVLAKTGATFVHPYDNYNIIAGQGTAALEMLAAEPDLEMILAPVGGGGLMSGTALACHYHHRDTIAVGCEPKMVDDAYRSYQSGEIETNENIDTIADGLRTNLGHKTLEIIRKHVAKIILVEEQTIVDAMRLIWERMKIVIEPSGAVPLAAVMTEPDFFRDKKIGIIISGGNVDLEKLPFSPPSFE